MTGKPGAQLRRAEPEVGLWELRNDNGDSPQNFNRLKFVPLSKESIFSVLLSHKDTSSNRLALGGH